MRLPHNTLLASCAGCAASAHSYLYVCAVCVHLTAGAPGRAYRRLRFYRAQRQRAQVPRAGASPPSPPLTASASLCTPALAAITTLATAAPVTAALTAALAATPAPSTLPPSLSPHMPSAPDVCRRRAPTQSSFSGQLPSGWTFLGRAQPAAAKTTDKRIKMHAGSIHLRTADNNSGARSPYAEGGLPGDAQATGNDSVNDSVVAQAPISNSPSM